MVLLLQFSFLLKIETNGLVYSERYLKKIVSFCKKESLDLLKILLKTFQNILGVKICNKKRVINVIFFSLAT